MVCPQTNDRNAKWFCPAWQPAVWTNPQGEERLINCVFEAQHLGTIEAVRAANATAVEINETRNAIVDGFNGLHALAAARVATRLLEE